VQFTGRNAAEDVSLGGVEILKGKQALVLIGSANNDPSVFEDPRRLDITRANARDHVSFSSGAHYCLGASLARLEGEVAFSAFTERFPGLRLAGKPLRKRTDLLRGYERVAVTAI
jgi:cytochrome P450